MDFLFQTILCFGLLAVPVGINFVSFLMKKSSQDVTNYCVYCVSTVGTAGNAGFLLATPRYRKRIRKLFFSICIQFRNTLMQMKTLCSGTVEKDHPVFIASSRGFLSTA
ncbi:hypothetical protein Y032_0030g2231 [Ancylostoma ceylanicum]|uniref:Uncharacterized protein n=1 Tax=Ancylostoma ceylanicum TaxID=53326 RepID=A0A016US05_9BILA|nr:hypothetical protein Y032_0030g2231 [Ancylostoma ceylanicum]